MTEPKNKTKTSEFHIGQSIRRELARQGRTITWLAGEVHCTRENLYRLFRHSWISTDTLFEISEALQHDFFKECSEQLSFVEKSKKEKGNCE